MTEATAVNVTFSSPLVEDFRSIATIAALRALSTVATNDRQNILVEGDLAAGDTGGGSYVFIADSLAEDDNAGVIRPDDRTPLQAGRWIAVGAHFSGGKDITGAHMISYGARVYETVYVDAVSRAQQLGSQVVGFANTAGTIGGGASTIIYLMKEGDGAERLRDYLNRIKIAAVPAIVLFAPTGYFDINLNDILQIYASNVTLCAPGRNATLWSIPTVGGLYQRSDNIIFYGFKMATAPSTWDDTTERKLNNVVLGEAGRIAFMSCDFRRAADGAIDASSSTYDTTDPVSGLASLHLNMTIQDCIFTNVDQVMLFGSTKIATATPPTWAATALTQPRRIHVTIWNCIFDHCAQRLPKVMGLAEVDIANCLIMMQPWEREYTWPTHESAASGVHTLHGGWATIRGCLFVATVGSEFHGVDVETAALSPPGGGLGVTGGPGAVIEYDNATEDGITLGSVNASSITPPPYLASLPAPEPPAPGQGREEWIAEKWRTAGAGRNAGPEGLWVTEAPDFDYPNGDYVRTRREDDLLEVRVDPVRVKEYAPALQMLPRGRTLTVTTSGPLGVLDVGGDTKFAVAGEGGVADTVNRITYNGSTAIPSGVTIRMRIASGAAPITFATGDNINLPSSLTLSNTNDLLTLEYDDVLGWVAASLPRRVLTKADITDLQTLASGTYTPAISATTNVAASTPLLCQWLRVGNTVTVSGGITLTPTATATSTNYTLSLPIASDLALAQDCAGTSFSNVTAGGVGGMVASDITNNGAFFKYLANGTTAVNHYFTFTYTVK